MGPLPQPGPTPACLLASIVNLVHSPRFSRNQTLSVSLTTISVRYPFCTATTTTRRGAFGSRYRDFKQLSSAQSPSSRSFICSSLAPACPRLAASVADCPSARSPVLACLILYGTERQIQYCDLSQLDIDDHTSVFYSASQRNILCIGGSPTANSLLVNSALHPARNEDDPLAVDSHISVHVAKSCPEENSKTNTRATQDQAPCGSRRTTQAARRLLSPLLHRYSFLGLSQIRGIPDIYDRLRPIRIHVCEAPISRIGPGRVVDLYRNLGPFVEQERGCCHTSHHNGRVEFPTLGGSSSDDVATAANAAAAEGAPDQQCLCANPVDDIRKSAAAESC